MNLLYIHRSRNSLILLAAILLSALTYLWFYAYIRVPSLDVFYTDPQDNAHSNDLNRFFNHHFIEGPISGQKAIQNYLDYKGIEDLRPVQAHCSVYDTIFENHDVNAILTNLNFDQRCDLYFTTLYSMDKNWWLNPNEDLPLQDRGSFKYQSWREKYFKKYKEELNKNKPEKEKDSEEGLEELIKHNYEVFWNRTLKTEQTITDYLCHMRIFNRCFITDDERDKIDSRAKFTSNQKQFVQKLYQKSEESPKSRVPSFELTEHEKTLKTDSFSSCTNVESRVYPWLSLRFPIYERWTGESYFSLPDMSKFMDIPNTKRKQKPVIKSAFTHSQSCFLNKFKNAVNGKGIVLTIGDEHVELVVNLIHLLRALNNDLPVQFVYYDGLSEASKLTIITAARESMRIPESHHKVKEFFPEGYFENSNSTLIPQEVWFVNVNGVVQDFDRKKFKTYSNKFLATMFNSFEEFILIDADTVLVQPPSYFFNLTGYKEKGAYFFRDRTLDVRPAEDSIFFKKTSPSSLDSIMFDIPTLTNYTFDLPFFGGLRHNMESGVVVLNRSRHFGSILVMMQLNFMGPIMERVHGDKEVFWLGFAANGDEDYVFNSYTAASLGEITEAKYRKTSSGSLKKAQEICSAHPAHVNGEDKKTLLWFNSGFQYCGRSDRVNFKDELRKNFHSFIETEGQLETYYRNPLRITHAIVPPYDVNEPICRNNDDEPIKGWQSGRMCAGYMWCAYSQVGGKTNDNKDNTQIGTIIEFNEKDQALFTYYGDVWTGKE
ncbi:mannosyltransferase [Scheffersomyces xylosifermentans]|uniref:mannosyltransferase n=1 Tax=Scheffersomyces xylosifermentans TaxID=1304137 RepID=UPI00315CF649